MKRFTREDWQKHVAAAAEHAGGVKGYCREQGIGNSRFHYWKKKLRERRKKVQRESAFAKVEVVPEASASKGLPDPKWLAEFLLAMGGSR